MSQTELMVIEPGDLTALPAQIDAAIADVQKHAAGMVESAVRAGQLLLTAKASVAHGSWEQWVTDNCTVAPRTARAYMRLAERLPQLPEPQRQRVAEMPLRWALQAITTAPEAPEAPRWVPVPRGPRSADTERKLKSAARRLKRIGDDFGLSRRIEVERIENARKVLLQALAGLDEVLAAQAQEAS